MPFLSNLEGHFEKTKIKKKDLLLIKLIEKKEGCSWWEKKGFKKVLEPLFQHLSFVNYPRNKGFLFFLLNSAKCTLVAPQIFLDFLSYLLQYLQLVPPFLLFFLDWPYLNHRRWKGSPVLATHPQAVCLAFTSSRHRVLCVCCDRGTRKCS